MAPLPFYIIALAVLAISHPATLPAEAFNRVSARDDASFPEPIIYHNLTRAAFITKLSEHRRSVKLGQRASLSISKRVVVRREDKNTARQQSIVEALSGRCAESARDHTFRVLYGSCLHAGLGRTTCNSPDLSSFHRVSSTWRCISTEDRPKKCVIEEVYNYKGNNVRVPWCDDVVSVEKETEKIDDVPVFEGHIDIERDLVEERILDEAMSPGTLDAFYGFGQELGITGHFEYHGMFASGKAFHSQSPEQANSWACLGCPPGKLSVEATGSKATVLGMTFPAGSWS